MTADRDRTVHATLPDGAVLARYDRSGKWYLEHPEATGKKRQLVTLKRAVGLALTSNVVHLNRPGGQMFDAAYRRAHAARGRATGPED